MPGILTALLLWMILLQAPASSSKVEVRTLESGTIQGILHEANARQIVVESSGEKRTLTNDSILSIGWGREATNLPENEILIQLINGDWLYGTMLESEGESFQFRLGSGKVFSLRVDVLRRWIQRRHARNLGALSFETDGASDRIYRKNGAAMDYIDGALESIGKEGTSFHSESLGKTMIPWEELAALVLTPIDPPKPSEKLQAVLDLIDGSSLTGELLGVEESTLKFKPVYFEESSFRFSDIVALRFKNGKFVFLPDLTPSKVEELTPFGGSDSIAFPYQKDRSVGGGPLQVGGRKFRRGLGVHSRCVLTYALERKYRIFRTQIGIDDEVLEFPSKGSVIFRIHVDDKIAFESKIVRGGTAAVAVPDIDVQGAQKLTLEVDYADDFHIADRADWLEPLLIP